MSERSLAVPIEQWATTALLGAYAAVALWLVWASLTWPLIHDAPILHYIAWRIADGAVPYRDVFDMNQPGVYLIHLAILRLVGDGDAAWRLVDLTWLAAAALTIRAFARPWGPLASWGGALTFAVYHLASGAWQAGQRDYMLVPFILGGALGVARWLEDGERRTAHLVTGGLLLGAAITVKPHVALLAAALGAVVVTAEPVTAGRPRATADVRARAALAYLAAVTVAPVAVLAWLASKGALAAWWDIVARYLVPLYSRVTRSGDWGLYRWTHWVPLALAVVLSLASALVARRFTPRHVAAVIGLAYGLVHFFGQRKGWEYHLYPLAAFAAVLAFAEIGALLRARAWPVAVPLAAFLVAVLVFLGIKGAETVQANWVWDKERVVRQLVSDLAPRLGPGDTVQVLDTTEGGIHALLRLRRREPTRFLYDFHFYHHVDAPMIRRLRAELVRDLVARPPRVVVVFAHGWPSRGYDRLDGFPELARLLATSYAPVLERPAYVILARRDGS